MERVLSPDDLAWWAMWDDDPRVFDEPDPDSDDDYLKHWILSEEDA